MLVHHLEDLESPMLDPYRELKRTNLTRWSQWFIAEGKRVVERLLQSDCGVYSVLLAEKRFESFGPTIPEDIPILVVPDDLCSQLVGFDFHTGVMACGVRPPKRCLSTQIEALNKRHTTFIACPNTTLPDNLGSIMRLAAAFEMEGLILGSHSADPFSRRAIRVSMGNIFQLGVFEPPDLVSELKTLKRSHGFAIAAANQSTQAINLQTFAWPERTILILGNEADGVSDDLLAICDHEVQIPMADNVDSLNVTTAATIFMYERSRTQRMER
ncbi:MAG: RNA methyltransferase [Pirellulaceae bacterium]